MPLTRLSLEERIRLVRLYSMYEKATHIQKAWKKQFGTDPPSRKTIAALNKKFDETGSVADLSRSGRPKSSRTEEKVAMVQAALKKDPSRSIRSLSTELGVNKAAVHRIKQDTEKKKSMLGAEIRRLKEKISNLQRRLETEGHGNEAKSTVDTCPQTGNARDHFMSSMDQYIIQKHEMFETTLIDVDDNSNDILNVPADPKAEINANESGGDQILRTNSAGAVGNSQAAQLTASVAAVMSGLDLALPLNNGVQREKNAANVPSFGAGLLHDLHHPNNCPQHPIGCHMCYITNVN